MQAKPPIPISLPIQMTALISLVSLILLIAAPAPAARAQDGAHIKLQSLAEVEKQVVTADGHKETKRVLAGKVTPGTEVIFTTLYENVSSQTVEKAVITNPIPEHMTFKDGSAAGADTRITFSIDNGATFDVPSKLFVTDAAGRSYPARPEDYTHIRWTFTTPLPSGAKGEVSFRAILN